MSTLSNSVGFELATKSHVETMEEVRSLIEVLFRFRSPSR